VGYIYTPQRQLELQRPGGDDQGRGDRLAPANSSADSLLKLQQFCLELVNRLDGSSHTFGGISAIWPVMGEIQYPDPVGLLWVDGQASAMCQAPERH
jgi:hypothetical protein